MKHGRVVLDVVANNLPGRGGFEPGWGNACLVRAGGETVLFDAGGDGKFLLHNLMMLKVAPGRIGSVVISHDHDDHTGGLWDLLAARPPVRIFAPAGMSRGFKARVRSAGARLVEVCKPMELVPGIHSTGPMRGRKREQSLAVETKRGLVVITGCAHPGIARIVGRCVKALHAAPHLVMGGVHLRDAVESELVAVIGALRRLGVERVAPNHCTGALAILRFRSEWGKDCIETGCGSRIVITG